MPQLPASGSAPGANSYAPDDATVAHLRDRAQFIRLETIRLIDIAKTGHYTSVFSAAEMFAAKSDVSAFGDADLLRMDSKEFELDGKKLRVSVLETTSPAVLLARKDALMAAMPGVASADGADEVLLFVVDILNEEATMLVPNAYVKQVAEASFGVPVSGDTVVLPGVMSRKKQIIPSLKL